MPSYRLICGDVIDSMRGLEDASVGVIVTSPPYNLGVRYGDYKDNMGWTNYLLWMRVFSRECERVLAIGGSFFLNYRRVGGTHARESEFVNVFSREFVIQNSIAWVKSITVNEVTTGQFRPLNGERFLNRCWEPVLHLTHRGDVKLDRLAVGVHMKDKANVSRWKHGRDTRCGGDAWFIPAETVQRREGNPNPFPVGLPERCIRLHGVKKNPLVLDPFCGSGATLVAATRLGLSSIGIDQNQADIDIARERIEAERRQ